jgi:hypothetical protein
LLGNPGEAAQAGSPDDVQQDRLNLVGLRMGSGNETALGSKGGLLEEAVPGLATGFLQPESDFLRHARNIRSSCHERKVESFGKGLAPFHFVVRLNALAMMQVGCYDIDFAASQEVQ